MVECSLVDADDHEYDELQEGGGSSRGLRWISSTAPLAGAGDKCAAANKKKSCWPSQT